VNHHPIEQASQRSNEEYRDTSPDSYGYSRYVAAVFMLRNHLKAMTDARTGDILAT